MMGGIIKLGRKKYDSVALLKVILCGIYAGWIFIHQKYMINVHMMSDSVASRNKNPPSI